MRNPIDLVIGVVLFKVPEVIESTPPLFWPAISLILAVVVCLLI